MRRVLFTDLDGTLLDHRSYDFRPALPAIRRLQQLQIPIVLCSSKTAAEMIPLRQDLGISDPFVVENGGGIYFPRGAGLALQGVEERGEFGVIALGPRMESLAQFLDQFSSREGVEVRSFLDLTPQQLATEVGLTLEEASRALKREFDLPFEPLDDKEEKALEDAARQRDLRVTRGGRFGHLVGTADKGTAVRRVVEIYRRTWNTAPATVGLGDSLNDLEMLRAVQSPIVIPNPHSSASLRTLLPRAVEAPEPGPRGWNRAVLSLLNG